MGIRVLFEGNGEERIKVIKIPIALKRPGASKEKTGEREFVLEWEAALGYKENPFKIEIMSPVSKYIANLESEKERANLFVITNKKFGTVTGEEGAGKTIFLMWLEEQLQKFKHKIVVNYIDWSEAKTNIRLVRELFRPSSGFKAFSDKELDGIDTENFDVKLKEELGNKKYVLLIDNLQKFTKERFLFLDKLITMNTQIIITGGKELSGSLDSIRSWLDGRGIHLKDELNVRLDEISLTGTKEMIAKRIAKAGGKSLYPFDEELLKSIWLKAKKNPKRIIELCHDYAIELSVKKSDGIKIEDIRSYQKDGIKLEKSEPEDDFLIEGNDDAAAAVRGKDYKIKVINKNESVVMEEEKGEEKKKKRYVIKGRKK